MKEDMDELLKQALTPNEEPDFWLNQKILTQVKETDQMDGKKICRRLPAAAIAAAVVLGAGSVTAYAAWKYLTPQEVTENLSDQMLTEAFSGKDAVLVKERQSYGGYDVTFLGLVSGRELSRYKRWNGGKEVLDRTYIVTAIENSDGTPLPDISDDAFLEVSFFVSPLIRGYDPNDFNAVTMRGSYQEFVENGVLYRMTECDNVEIFADKGLYLCVTDSSFYDPDAYHYKEETGEITRNEAYEKLNALFDLPIDPSKADPGAAAAYKTSLEEGSKGEASHGADAGHTADGIFSDTADMEREHAAVSDAADQWMEKITPDNIEEYAERVESTVQVLTPDADGNVSYKYEIQGRGSGSGTLNVPWFFKGKGPGMSPYFDYNSSENGLESLRIETFTLNEDGTMTFAVYIPKNL